MVREFAWSASRDELAGQWSPGPPVGIGMIPD
jgi:hypothetical protein